MSDIGLLYTALLKPRACIKAHTPLILLSHMRAYTSLLGHVLGSSPEIAGYYEQHIGYYSKKSFMRLKLLYYKEHEMKARACYIFDKVLHDYHYVDIDLLNINKAKIIFAIREPEQTIKSIAFQFKNKRPGHPYCDVDEAARYYVRRVASLGEMASKCNSYFYLDAESLKSDTYSILSGLSRWLHLEFPLGPDFDQFKHTGDSMAGDQSGNLLSGKIKKIYSDYSSINVSEDLLKDARATYKAISEQLVAGASNQIIK